MQAGMTGCIVNVLFFLKFHFKTYTAGGRCSKFTELGFD